MLCLRMSLKDLTAEELTQVLTSRSQILFSIECNHPHHRTMPRRGYHHSRILLETAEATMFRKFLDLLTMELVGV
jgi:hypothetical protein